MKKRKLFILITVMLVLVALSWGVRQVGAQQAEKSKGSAQKAQLKQEFSAPAKRKAAAARFQQTYDATMAAGTTAMAMPALAPGAIPHYFGPYPNYANSPLPMGPATVILTSPGSGYSLPTVTIADLYTGSYETLNATVDGVGAIIDIASPTLQYYAPFVTITDPTGIGAAAAAIITPAPGTGIRKFVDPLPSLTFAVPDTTTYDGSDYYEIELGQYSKKMHSDLPPTTLRGYRQVNTAGPASQFSYLGPVIVAQRDRPVRIKFINNLPTGTGGNLFIPVDTTIMGAGMGPDGTEYAQNRATIHLHGNNTVWISDGTPHQWTTPALEGTSYPKGVSVYNVPDMPNPGKPATPDLGAGTLTFYYTNAQSARLQFYHDHAYGITRLNVYVGEAAGYLITDPVEQDLIDGTNDSGVNPGGLQVLPDYGIPLIIQDKTFIDANTIAYQDPTWNWGTTPGTPNTGDLWFPHVYMPNQNPWDLSGMNAFGRWHYGPWFWPPATGLTYPPIPNPYADPTNPEYGPWEPPMIPATPNPSSPAEAFMDTPLVNGNAYPYLEVEPKPYRLRILNAANDRFFNLQLYKADPAGYAIDASGNPLPPGTGFGTEVKMVPAVPTPGFPADWPTDGREGGVPDPATAGPKFIQIGTEGGFLPAPVELPNRPVDWNMDQTNFDMGLVKQGTLILGTAERADVIVDFSAFAGETLILYNDAPAPFPAIDPRYDYYTGNPDQTDIGGTPSTMPGYGPNTRTIMQIRVLSTATDPIVSVDLPTLEAVFAENTATGKRGVFEVSQDEIIVPSADYNSAYDAAFPADPYVRIFENSKTFQTVSGSMVTLPFEPKAIQDEMGEAFDIEYGRMSAMLGLERPASAAGAQNFMLYPYNSPPVEIVKNTIFGTPIGALDDGTQIWKITHNGVDTHTIHTHLFNVQLVNRVAWDNALRLPDPNELGWKETLRVNPLQDSIVAFRAVAPTYDAVAPFEPNSVPFLIPNSVRPIDVTKPVGAPLTPPLGGFKDPLGNPVTVNNNLVNYGWEYVYHCHLLAHEEMDMMHSVAVAVAPDSPSNLSATGLSGPLSVNLTWTDNSVNETNFIIERATDAGFTTGLTTFTVAGSANGAFGGTIAFTDLTVVANNTYYYRVIASNVVGDTLTVSFPTKSVNSAPSSTVLAGPPAAAPTIQSATQPGTANNAPVVLNWTDNSPNVSNPPNFNLETSFTVQRSTNGGGIWIDRATLAANPGTGAMVYTDATTGPNGVRRRTTYTYRIRANNMFGSSTSNTVTITTR